MLYDIGKRVWDKDLLKLFGVARDALPEVRDSSGDFGVAMPEHFGSEIPISGIAGDQQAALYGQGCWKPGQAKNTYGTGAFLLLNTGKKRATSGHGLLTTLACDAKGKPVYALEGSVFIAGAAMQWLREGLGPGLWNSADDFLGGRQFTSFAPSAHRKAVQTRAAEWHRAVQAALHWAG